MCTVQRVCKEFPICPSFLLSLCSLMVSQGSFSGPLLIKNRKPFLKTCSSQMWSILRASCKHTLSPDNLFPCIITAFLYTLLNIQYAYFIYIAGSCWSLSMWGARHQHLLVNATWIDLIFVFPNMFHSWQICLITTPELIPQLLHLVYCVLVSTELINPWFRLKESRQGQLSNRD